jgi:F-type H+-transporting ATPase subunit epsilon
VPLKVEIVSPEKRIFSGEASMVSARTLGVLVNGEVSIKGLDGSATTFTVHGGFLSVNKDRVSILGESAQQ